VNIIAGPRPPFRARNSVKLAFFGVVLPLFSAVTDNSGKQIQALEREAEISA
jgi:hypothetical protein